MHITSIPDSDLKNRVGVEFQKSSDANHLL